MTREVEGKRRISNVLEAKGRIVYERRKSSTVPNATYGTDRQLDTASCNIYFELAISNLFTKAMILLASFLNFSNF